MSDPVSGVIGAAGDVAGAFVNQATEEAVAKQQAQAELDYANTVFKNSTGYAANQQQAERDAMGSASAEYGNPYAQAGGLAKPQALSAPSTFGGTQFSGAGGGQALSTGFSGGTPPGSTQTSPRDADGTPSRLPNTPAAGAAANGGAVASGFAGDPTRRYPTGGAQAAGGASI